MGWAGLGRASLGQPARCRLSRRSRGPWVKPLTVSRRRPALSELRRLLCTCTEMAAVEQCRAGLGSAVQAWPGGREDGPEGACPTGKPPLPRERAARSRGRDLAGVQLVTVRVFHGRSHRWVVGGRRGLCRCGCLAGPRCSLQGPQAVGGAAAWSRMPRLCAGLALSMPTPPAASAAMVTRSVPSIPTIPGLAEPSSPTSGQEEPLPPVGKAHGCPVVRGQPARLAAGLLTDRRVQRGALFAGRCTVLGPDERI